VRPFIFHLPRRCIVAAAIVATLLSCGTKNRPQPSPLSADELYLVDAYIQVRRAGAYHPYQRSIADSLLSRLAGTVDTVRVARTMASLNASPERWALVLRTIEERLSARDSTATSETPGR